MRNEWLANVLVVVGLALIGAGLYLAWGGAVTLLFAGVVCLALFALLVLQPRGEG